MTQLFLDRFELIKIVFLLAAAHLLFDLLFNWDSSFEISFSSMIPINVSSLTIGLISSSSFCFNSRSISIIEAKRSASEWGSVSSMFFNTSSRVLFSFRKHSRARTRACREISQFFKVFFRFFASITSTSLVVFVSEHRFRTLARCCLRRAPSLS